MATQRRQIVILAAVVGLLVVLYFVAVVLGVTRPSSSGAVDVWTARLKGLDPAVAVDPAQLHSAGACSIDPSSRRVQLTGPCRIEVPAVGRFALRSSRRLTLAPAGQSVSFVTRVEDQQVKGTIDSGDAKRLGFGRAAAELILTCTGLPPCTVGLPA